MKIQVYRIQQPQDTNRCDSAGFKKIEFDTAKTMSAQEAFNQDDGFTMIQ